MYTLPLIKKTIFLFLVLLIIKPQAWSAGTASQDNTPTSGYNNDGDNLFMTRFYRPPEWPHLNQQRAAMCKKNFNSLCGKEDLPHLKKFVACLQEKYALLDKTNECELYAHGLIHMNILGTLPRQVSQCAVVIEDCERTSKSWVAITKCINNKPSTPGICIKLFADISISRKIMSNLFNFNLFDGAVEPKK